jgi:predicted ATPase
MLQKLILENVRCFRDRHEIPLRPLTFLIGENSTGKTTALATAHVGTEILRSGVAPDFNEHPFNLGSFEQISSVGSNKTNESQFSIGIEVDNGNSVIARFISISGQPSVTSLHITTGSGQLRVETKGPLTAEIVPRNGNQYKTWKTTFVGMDDEARLTPNWFSLLHVATARETESRLEIRSAAKELRSFIEECRHRLKTHPIAPIRSNPFRTYDPRTDAPRAEGDHVPMLLAKTQHNKGEWSRLRERLCQFGKASSLFSSIKFRRLGRSEGSPFQIMFKIAGAPAFNLMDVGYGVSQILPILVDSITNEEGSLFLMQQPEVHLHPKAQAEIGTLLGHLARNEKKQFIVETHSDYMIDRVCLDVRDKKNGLTPDDVMILYFQREKGWVKVHPITIDAKGNLVGAPKGYREFFLKEQARLFGV